MVRRPDPVGRSASTARADFEALYRRELPVMIALASTMTGDRDLAVDLAQEALTRAYRDWSTVSALDRPGAWVRRVVLNLSIDAHRRRQRDERIATHLASDEAVDQRVSMDERFWASVRALPERQRAAVALHYVEDRSVADIADVLGVTAGTVKTSLFMARRTLAAALGAEEVHG